MYIKCLVTKLMKNYQLSTFSWFKSLYPALTNMRSYLGAITMTYGSAVLMV